MFLWFFLHFIYQLIYVFVITVVQENPSGKDKNQGTVMVFNPDSSVSKNELHEIFGVYGDIMEVNSDIIFIKLKLLILMETDFNLMM